MNPPALASLRRPDDMIDREAEWARLSEFATSGNAGASLGVVWGRRRIGKSFLLAALVERTGGFYYQAVRGSSGESLRELGAHLGAHQKAAAPLLLERWEQAVEALLALGATRETVVVLDEYPYLQEHTPELDSIIQRAFGPPGRARASGRTRLILCGSAIAVMDRLLTGTAPLRGRAGLDLRVPAFDWRVARRLHGIEDLATAFRTFAVIGGVAAYGREMVDQDLPAGPGDFDRWVCRRVLSAAAPLFSEVALLLSEDPSTAKARKLNLYHATLAGVASGQHAYGKLTGYVKVSGPSLAPIVETLVSTGLIARVQDPIRENRPTYHPADSLVRFHYAVIRRHQGRLAAPNANTRRLWRHLRPTFESQVVGPCFEAVARAWTSQLASPDTLGGTPDYVGPSVVSLPDGAERQLDVVVAAGDAEVASARRVIALGEAKVGSTLGPVHLRRLDQARDALGDRAAGARLLLFGTTFSAALRRTVTSRRDVELVDLERLYHGH